MNGRPTFDDEPALDSTARHSYDPSVSQDLRYPIGKFVHQPTVTMSAKERAIAIDQIASAPRDLAAAVAGLTDVQFNTPYRPGGWTVRQVVNHVPDSHLNAYVRCKLIVTEDDPALKTYQEERWAELTDGRNAPIDVSLSLLTSLHHRWVMWLRSLDEAAFGRRGQHPEWGSVRVDDLLQLYAWHGRHHTAHIQALRDRESWR